MRDKSELPATDSMTSAAANGSHDAHHCADNFDEIHRTGARMISGVEIPVEESLFRCRVCGEEEYSLAQAERAQRAAAAQYRELYGFLQPDEIVVLRKRLGLTQHYLERILGLGKKTVARWEAGRVLQSRAMDNLLRAISHAPALLDFFAQRAGLGNIDDVAETPVAAHTPLESMEQQRQNADTPQLSVDTFTTIHLTVQASRADFEREPASLSVLAKAPRNVNTWVLPMRQERDSPWLAEHRAIHPAYASAG